MHTRCVIHVILIGCLMSRTKVKISLESGGSKQTVALRCLHASQVVLRKPWPFLPSTDMALDGENQEAGAGTGRFQHCNSRFQIATS